MIVKYLVLNVVWVTELFLRLIFNPWCWAFLLLLLLVQAPLPLFGLCVFLGLLLVSLLLVLGLCLRLPLFFSLYEDQIMGELLLH